MIGHCKKWIFPVVAAVVAAMGAAGAAELLDVRFGPNGEATRIVFDINGAPAYAVSGDELGQGRLIVDFEGLVVKPADRGQRPGKGHIQAFEFKTGAGSNVRAELAFKRTAKIKEVFVIAPAGAVKKHRLVIDLETADRKAFLASLPSRYPDLGAVIERATAPGNDAPAAFPQSPTQREVALPRKDKKTIVVDAGHGGNDPGAQGQSGTYEKAVTLKAALALSEILKKKGYEVVLTRKNDAKIPLDKREARARKADADLFISLHADALAAKAVRGGSVYTLSKQGSVRSAKLAKADGNYRINNLDVEQEFGQAVGGMLFDITQDYTSTASSLFAATLLQNLTGKTPLLNRSHRTGDLRVLLAPDVPAVLFEMAYISNVKDEANLNSPVWRKRTMTAVADSIDTYFNDHDPRRFAGARAAGAQ